MTARRFFDTNMLVYACDASEPAKQTRALELIAEAAAQADGALSVQVFGEFFHATVIRRKLLAADEAERIIHA